MRKRIITLLFLAYLCIGNILIVSATETDEVTEESTEAAPVMGNISVVTENVKAPGEAEFRIQLTEEGSVDLSRLSLVFRGENNTEEFLYYWLDEDDIVRTETAGEYSGTIELAENVAADTYILNEIIFYDQAGQNRSYALNADTGLLTDWAGGYEAETLKLLVVEGCTDTDYDVPILQGLSFVQSVYTGETLEVTVTATDASGIRDASIVFYNSYMEQYLYLNSVETTVLDEGKYKFSFKIHRYQYPDIYEFDSITLTDDSMHRNSVSYWLEDSSLKNVDGHVVGFSNSKKYLTLTEKDNIHWATIYTSDFYSAVSSANANETVAIIGGDSDGSQWIMDKRPLYAASIKNLTLILPNLLSETEIVIDTASIPQTLPDEVYAGIGFSKFENGYFDLQLQMTSSDIPFRVKFKTEELESLKDKVFMLCEVAEDGTETLVNDRLIVDKEGYLNLEFLSGIDSGDGWSNFRLVRDETADCEGEHEWPQEAVLEEATLSEAGYKLNVCEVCGTVESQNIPRINTISLSTTKFIYNGYVKKPVVTVKDTEGKKLVSGTDYTVSYATGRKSVGRYAVTVTFQGDYSGTSTKYFTIVPKAVTNLQAIRYQYGNKIRLSWTKSTGATGYRIYRKKASADSYTYLGAAKNTYYINSGLSKNVSYRYKIIPYYKTSTGTTHYYSSNAYKTVLITAVKKGSKLSQVTGVKTAKSGTKVKVSWKNVGYETGYQISRSTLKTGTNIVATYKTTSGTSKTVSATKNKTYYYKVRAYRVVDGKMIYGAWSDTVKYTRK